MDWEGSCKKCGQKRGDDITLGHHPVVAELKSKMKTHSKIGQATTQKFNTLLCRHFNKLRECKITLNNFHVLRDLLEEVETTTKSNWKAIKEARILKCYEVLEPNKHQRKEWITADILDNIQERKARKTEVSNK